MSDQDDAALLEAESAEALAYQAKEVQHLLAQDGVKRAFAATRERIIRQWEAVPLENPLGREMCRHKLAAFKDLLTELRAFGDRRPHLTSE